MSKGKFLTADEKETIVRLHKKGEKVTDIAKEVGRAVTAVYRVLRTAGVPGRFATKAVRNTRPAKKNGQTTIAAGELRQVIDRKREELEALEKALVIVEVGL